MSGVPGARPDACASMPFRPDSGYAIASLAQEVEALWDHANAGDTPDDEVASLICGEAGSWAALTEYAATLRPTTLPGVMSLARVASVVRRQMALGGLDGPDDDDAAGTVVGRLDHAVAASLAALSHAA